jgi:hypothetical protein
VVGGLAALGYRVATSGAAERQGIVHRLDVGTTGVMVVATSEHAYTVLKRAFKERTVDKRYHAVCQGHPDPSSGTIDAPIDRHPRHDHRFAVVAGGRPSVTHYDTLEAFPAASLLDIHLETGRTHQIRVHLSALRHPCVGDPHLRRRPGAREAARAHAAVAARPLARLRAPRRRPVGRVREPVSRRSRRRAGSAARVTTRGRLALLAACGVVAALVALYTAVRTPAPTSGPPPGSVRLGPEPGEAVAAYLPRAAATLPPAGTTALALVQFADERTVADAAAPGTATEAVFRVDLPRVQTALRFVPLETGSADRPRHRPATGRERRLGRRGQAHGPRRGGRGGRGRRADQAGMPMPRRTGRHRRRRSAPASRRRGAGDRGRAARRYPA